MNIFQRIVLVLVALSILIGGLITLIDPNISFIEFFAYLSVIIVAALFFFFGFSSPELSKRKNRVTDGSRPKVATTQEVPIYTHDLDKQNSQNAQKLQNLMVSADKTLYKISSVFPFDLFPNDLIIEHKQILIVDRYFFFSRREFPILIKNLLTPVLETSILFASLQIEIKGFEQDPLPIHFLKKNEATRARKIIMGLIVCDREGVDLSKFATEEVVARVEEIGKVRGE